MVNKKNRRWDLRMEKLISLIGLFGVSRRGVRIGKPPEIYIPGAAERHDVFI